jgi:pimeloyl-ACP methyl ester carboxylesterase
MQKTEAKSPTLPTRRSALRRWSRRVLYTFATALIAIEVAGCSLTGTLANQVVGGPNAGRQVNPAGDPSPDDLRSNGVTRQFRVDAGAPNASLLVWVIDPPASALVHSSPKGTIVCLHGHAADKRQMLAPAQAFAAAGYRAVLFDSRSNGRSSGDYLTYGVVESRDARQVLDALNSAGLVSGQVGAFGRSYGGATAIQWAAIDPRVRAVVTVSSFATMRDAVHDASKAMGDAAVSPSLAAGLADRRDRRPGWPGSQLRPQRRQPASGDHRDGHAHPADARHERQVHLSKQQPAPSRRRARPQQAGVD